MVQARRGRVNLLGIDPNYTRQAEREGGAEGLKPSRTPVENVRTPADERGSSGASGEGLLTAEPHDHEVASAEPRTEERAAGRRSRSRRSPPKPEGMTRQVRVGLSVKASERLAEVSREQGVSVAVIGKALRARVVARFMQLLEKGERPSDQVVHRGGHAERVFIRLQGELYDRAQSWFDPMDLGEAAMTDAMRPVLARFFEEELHRIARRR